MPEIGYQGVSPYDPDDKNHRREIARVLNNVLQGKQNVNFRVTLSAGISTTITDARIGVGSALHFMPESAQAAGIRPYVPSSSRTNGSVIVNHATISSTATVYLVTIIG